MAFPGVTNSGSGNSAANITGGNNWSFSFGFTATAGRMLILICAADGNPTLTVSGWTNIFETPDGTVCKLGAWKKIAVGGETSQNISPSTTESLAATIYEISGHNGLTDVNTTTASTGSTANPNPPNLDPSGWGTEDTLWIACCGWDQNKTCSAYPTNYGSGNLTSVYNNATHGCGVASAYRTVNAASQDPGTFTISAADNSVANTIAVRTDQTISGTASKTLDNVTSSASGSVVFTGTSSPTLAGDTSAASGTVVVPVTGTVAVTLANDTSAASGSEILTGTSAVTLGGITSSASGTESMTGTVAVSLSGITSSASGTESMTGTSTPTLGGVTTAGTGALIISGTSAVTLGGLTSGASGLEVFTGTLARTLDGVTVVASGSTAGAGATGTVAVTLDGITSAASGTHVENATGTLAATLGGVTSSASGAEILSGTSAATLAGTTLAASGTSILTVTGTSAVTLSGVTSTASGIGGESDYDVVLNVTADYQPVAFNARATTLRLIANAVTFATAGDATDYSYNANRSFPARLVADAYTADEADYQTFTLSANHRTLEFTVGA